MALNGHWEINGHQVSDEEAWHGANPQAVWVRDGEPPKEPPRIIDKSQLPSEAR